MFKNFLQNNYGLNVLICVIVFQFPAFTHLFIRFILNKNVLLFLQIVLCKFIQRSWSKCEKTGSTSAKTKTSIRFTWIEQHISGIQNVSLANLSSWFYLSFFSIPQMLVVFSLLISAYIYSNGRTSIPSKVESWFFLLVINQIVVFDSYECFCLFLIFCLWCVRLCTIHFVSLRCMLAWYLY